MPSSSRFRVPKATITGAYGAAMPWFCRRRVARFDARDPHLESFHLEDVLVTGPAHATASRVATYRQGSPRRGLRVRSSADPPNLIRLTPA